jgi:hypothetical protein
MPGDVRVDAIFMTNLDTQRSTSFDAPSPPRSAEVPTGLAPAPEAAAPPDPSLKSYSEPLYSEHAAPQPLTTSNIAADEMGQAYDGLHRIQAMLAYLKMMKQENLAIGQYLDQAKHTCGQALCQCQARDLAGAGELAAASSSLSRLVEILISRAFHPHSDYPKLVPPPPSTSPHTVIRVSARMTWIESSVCSRASVGSLKMEPCHPKSEGKYKHFHRGAKISAGGPVVCLKAGAMEDAIEFAQAADAAECVAEHLCKRCYVTRGADSSAAAS